MTTQNPEVAFYYPNPMWRDADWLKNLILFFDGIALLVPTYMRDRLFGMDPAIIAGLEEHNLLHILEPETLIDKKAAQTLAESMTDIIVSGALDNLARQPTSFQELSYSRLGGMADAGLANMIYDELVARGLAHKTRDGVSIPMHPMIRSLILVLLSQILRTRGRELGLDLQPATDRPEIHAALIDLLNLPPLASSGHVVSLDAIEVGLDLSAVPFDDVLRFRAEHQSEYRMYARDLRKFVADIVKLPREEQQAALEERRMELQEAAARLRDGARSTWASRARFGFSIAGAVWQLAQHDIVGSLLMLGSALPGSDLVGSTEVGAYSYLFRAKERFF